MAKTIVGLFNSMPEARSAVRDLEGAGFSRIDISMVASMSEGASSGSGTASGAGAGVAIGGGVGLIAGMASLAIPGFGPVVAAGPIAAAVAAAGVDGVGGGLVGGLAHVGVSREDAEYFAEGVRRGVILVVVRAADTMAIRAADAIGNHCSVPGRKSGPYLYNHPTETSARPRKRKRDPMARAYKFGRAYASDQRHGDGDWPAMEAEIRRNWESRDPGSWEEMKGAIRRGWDKVRIRRA